MTDETTDAVEYAVAGVIPGLIFRLVDDKGEVERFPTVERAKYVASLHQRWFGHRVRVERWHPNLPRYTTMTIS